MSKRKKLKYKVSMGKWETLHILGGIINCYKLSKGQLDNTLQKSKRKFRPWTQKFLFKKFIQGIIHG
jgi:hypothetical protein